MGATGCGIDPPPPGLSPRVCAFCHGLRSRHLYRDWFSGPISADRNLGWGNEGGGCVVAVSHRRVHGPAERLHPPARLGSHRFPECVVATSSCFELGRWGDRYRHARRGHRHECSDCRRPPRRCTRPRRHSCPMGRKASQLSSGGWTATCTTPSTEMFLACGCVGVGGTADFNRSELINQPWLLAEPYSSLRFDCGLVRFVPSVRIPRLQTPQTWGTRRRHFDQHNDNHAVAEKTECSWPGSAANQFS